MMIVNLRCEYCNKSKDVDTHMVHLWVEEDLFQGTIDYICNGLGWKQIEFVGWLCSNCINEIEENELIVNTLFEHNYNPNIRCRECSWVGLESELVERDDEWGVLMDVCPNCGSSDIEETMLYDEESDDGFDNWVG